MRSSGKVTLFSVSITPVPTAALSVWAHAFAVIRPDIPANVSVQASNHPVFFMLPPNSRPGLACGKAHLTLCHKRAYLRKLPRWYKGVKVTRVLGAPSPLGKTPENRKKTESNVASSSAGLYADALF